MFEEQFNAIMAAILEGFDGAPMPTVPGVPGESGGANPFANTTAALMDSGNDVALFGETLSGLPEGNTSAGIQSSFAAYQTAFENAPGYLESTMNDDPPDVAAELATGAAAVAAGADSIAASAADEIGTDADGDSGVTFAAETLVTGGDVAGGVVTGAFGAGAEVFDAGAMRFANELAGAAPEMGDGPGPGQQFADAFSEGANMVADGISEGSNVVTGMVPGEISAGLNDGAQAFATAFGDGAEQLAMAIGGSTGAGPELPGVPMGDAFDGLPEFSPELVAGPLGSAITTVADGAMNFDNPLPFPGA